MKNNNLINSSRNKKCKTAALNALRASVLEKLSKKFQSDKIKYDIKTINDIIYNEKANIVGRFKDFLIYDDTSEFLKRDYKLKEITVRLPKIFTFYSSYSKIFPNYITISEAKYIYKNIQKKQKMIDKFQKNVQNEDSIEIKNNDRIFNTKIYNSLMNLTLYSLHKNSIVDNSIISNTNFNDNILNYSYKSFENIIDNINNAEDFSEKIIIENLEKIKINSQNVNFKENKSQIRKEDSTNHNSILDKISPIINKIGIDVNEDKNIKSIRITNIQSHKATSVPKLPINSINNHIYNNYNIINNFQSAPSNKIVIPDGSREFSPRINSSRPEINNYKSNNNAKKKTITNIQINTKRNNSNLNNVQGNNYLQLKIKGNEISTKNNLFASNNVINVKQRTLVSNLSTKNLLKNSININLKHLNLAKNNDILSAIPQTARQKVNFIDDSKELSKNVFSIKSNDSTCNSKRIKNIHNKNSSMPKANNLMKKEIFKKISSERQFSKPKNSLLKRNNSDLYKSLNNNKVLSSINISSNKLNSNKNYKSVSLIKKSSVAKESINLYKHMKRDLFSPKKNVEISLMKNTNTNNFTCKNNNMIKKTIQSHSKNGSEITRKIEMKNGIKIKNFAEITKSTNSNVSTSNRYNTIKK